MNLGIELDCAFGAVDRWANARDLGFPASADEDDEIAPSRRATSAAAAAAVAAS
jgi:hypothetical protein